MEMNLILLLIGLCSIALASANNITTTSRPKSQPTSKSGSVIKTLAKKTTTPAASVAPSNTTKPAAPHTSVTPSKAPTLLPTLASTTLAPKLNCSSKRNCGDCAKDYHCYWCGPAKQCLTYPSGRIIPKGCPKNDWYWKQCFIPGYILIIVVPVIIGLFLLTCGCCIYCKCCRTSNRGWKKEEERITAKRQERQVKAEERKSERKKTTDALRMKYGLLKSDDEEQLIS